MNIYVASSWRNTLQPVIVAALRQSGHEVYDFRNPAPGNSGFAWSEIDPLWQKWTPDEYREALKHPAAIRGYAFDIGALRACDACVLVLPSGRSASWEFGYAMGAGKIGAVVMFEPCEPELMYREAAILTSAEELRAWANVGGSGGRHEVTVRSEMGVTEGTSSVSLDAPAGPTPPTADNFGGAR